MIDKGFNHQWTPNATTFEAKPKPIDGCIFATYKAYIP